MPEFCKSGRTDKLPYLLQLVVKPKSLKVDLLEAVVDTDGTIRWCKTGIRSFLWQKNTLDDVAWTVKQNEQNRKSFNSGYALHSHDGSQGSYTLDVVLAKNEIKSKE
jgi:hypothetical protein